MTLREKIETMQAFDRGEYVEVRTDKTKSGTWSVAVDPIWDWNNNDYRIKPTPKQTVVIEKWLVTNKSRFDIAETTNIDEYIDGACMWTKVKLLDTYEVEL